MATNSHGLRAEYRLDPEYRARENVLDLASMRKRKENPEYRQHRKSLNRDYIKADPRRPLYYGARKRAKAKGLEFSLELEDIVVPELCPVLGIKLVAGEGTLVDSSPSLDRLVPELGYVPGNVAVISYKANRIKNNGSREDVMKVAAWMAKTGSGI